MVKNETKKSKLPESRLEFQIQMYSNLLRTKMGVFTRLRYERKLNALLKEYYSK